MRKRISLLLGVVAFVALLFGSVADSNAGFRNRRCCWTSFCCPAVTCCLAPAPVAPCCAGGGSELPTVSPSIGPSPSSQTGKSSGGGTMVTSPAPGR